MKKIVLLALLFSLSATTLVTAQSEISQQEAFSISYHNSKALVKTQAYKFVANVVHNGLDRELLDGEVNQISISKLNVSGQLQGFSKDKVIYTLKESNATIDTVFNDENQQISIVIEAKLHNLSIVAKPNGKAFLTLTDSSGAQLNYTGQLVKL
ncbi:hypothetical protein [Winogradskyella sp. PC D3.3]